MDDTNDTLTVRLKPAALDEIDMGVLRTSLDGRMLYMNRLARELAGPDVAPGATVQSLHLPDDSRQLLESRIAERRHSSSGWDYPLTVDRPDIGTQVHLRVSAVPELSLDGDVIGSIGLITDETMRRANLKIHEEINGAADWQGLLQAVDMRSRDVIAFDAIIISLISADRNALRKLYDRPKMETAAPAWRWWPMPAFVKADLIRLTAAQPDDVLALFESESYREMARNDIATREWLKLGYRHMLRRPVMRGGELQAMVTLLRLEDKPFSSEDAHRMDQLPIGEAVNMALALDAQKALEFGLELIGQLGAVAGDIDDVAKVLTQGLRTNFGWEHVSLFRVDTDAAMITLVEQAANEGSRLPTDYTQSITHGLLGHVALSGQPVRAAEVSNSDIYVEGIAGTRSEMCLPVPGQPVRWILNVESTIASAFASEEQDAVSRLLKVAGMILDRTMALQFNATVLESVADAVIQTTTQGRIQHVNRACVQLLERPAETMIGSHFSTLISAPGDEPDPPGFATRLVGLPRLAPAEIELLPQQGSPIPVLLSGESLPPQLGGKVYVASDLRARLQVQRMDSLQQVFRQVASESRLPLGLISAYLSELGSMSLGEDADELIDRSLRQLRRADLPLERIVRLAALGEGQELPVRPIDLAAFAARLVGELPLTQAREVQIGPATGMPQVLATRQELGFCAASVLGFLLRMKAQRDAVQIDIDGAASRPVLTFGLVDAGTREPSDTRLEARSEQQRDFALAIPVIQGLMKRMRGGFELDQGHRLRVRLTFTATEAP